MERLLKGRAFVSALGSTKPPKFAKVNLFNDHVRLSFESFQSAIDYFDANRDLLLRIWDWHEEIGDRSEKFYIPGTCSICMCQTLFEVNPLQRLDVSKFHFQVTWIVDLACSCRRTQLDRSVAHVLNETWNDDHKIFHVGYHSAFRWWLTEMKPNIVASQYQVGRSPGEIENGVLYEDLTQLSFPDGEFDDIICMEVLEHLPEYKSALRQMARVLKRGGRAIMSFPWLGGENYEHLIRAELKPDGSINHILPPEYHGDSAKSEGILSFRAFGWKILDEMREAGFSRASAEYIFGPELGFMDILTPVIVGVR